MIFNSTSEHRHEYIHTSSKQEDARRWSKRCSKNHSKWFGNVDEVFSGHCCAGPVISVVMNELATKSKKIFPNKISQFLVMLNPDRRPTFASLNISFYSVFPVWATTSHTMTVQLPLHSFWSVTSCLRRPIQFACTVGRAIVFAVNVALMSSQWQYRARIFSLHSPINAENESG